MRKSWIGPVVTVAVIALALLFFVPQIVRFASQARQTADQQAAQNLVDALVSLEQADKINFPDGATVVFAGDPSTRTIDVNAVSASTIQINTSDTLNKLLFDKVGAKIPLQTGDAISVTKQNGGYSFQVYTAS